MVSRLHLMPGSSPHTRGAQTYANMEQESIRIIPAYAGSTGGGRRGRGLARDHPRIRGEHGLGESKALLGHGSSPHTRGARGPDGRC